MSFKVYKAFKELSILIRKLKVKKGKKKSNYKLFYIEELFKSRIRIIFPTI